MLLREKTELGLGAMHETLAEQTAGPHGYLALNKVITAFEGVPFRIDEVEHPVFLVISEQKVPGDIDERQRGEDKGHNGAPPDTYRQRNGGGNETDHDGC